MELEDYFLFLSEDNTALGELLGCSASK